MIHNVEIMTVIKITSTEQIKQDPNDTGCKKEIVQFWDFNGKLLSESTKTLDLKIACANSGDNPKKSSY